MKTSYLWAAGLAGLPFLIILCLVATGNPALLAMDQAVNTALYGGHYPLLVPIIRAFTYLGDNYLQLTFIALLALWLLYKKRKTSGSLAGPVKLPDHLRHQPAGQIPDPAAAA
ncbi:hypothetical protein [Aerococcus sanguinicola]|uniref:hypothetical protein n=1 Tax=Aerococcus sanguinicola TaxID=119206 RepID=UPI0018A782B2|nr:hypothetical protein [Aerococcus sanguinicola]